MERFAIIGLGRFGMRLAKLLADAGAEIVAVDRDRELVDEVRDRVALAVALDCTDEEALRSQGIDKVDVAVVGIGTNFEDNALVTALLKQMGVPRVVSRAATDVRGRILSRIGADDVVNPEEESAERWRNRLLAPAVIERIEVAEGYSIVQIAAPESFHHKTLGDLDVRKNHQVNIVAIRRTREESEEGIKRTRQMVISVPMADTVIEPGDVLILVGSDEAMQKFPTR
ncbi:MAG: potassium channel family protein [Planctomycetota bacterium]